MSSVAARPPTPTAGTAATEEAARLFEEYSEEVFAYCLRHLGSRSEAEDAAQTTFLSALRALRRGVVPEQEAAWLTTIAKNACHTQRRTLGRRGSLTTEIDLDQIALARPDPDEAEMLAAMPAALASLPDNQRTAIVMREWRGLGPGEIASRLELTTTATNALLTRARQSLATALTATVRGPLSALNVGVLADMLRVYLKTLLGSAASKTAAVAVAATVSVGGVVAHEALGDRPAAPANVPVDEQASPVDATVARERTPNPKRAVSVPARPRGDAARAREPKVATPSRRPVVTSTDPTQTEPTHVAAPVAPVQTPVSAPPYTPSPGTPDEKSPAPEAPSPPPLPELPLPELGPGDPLIPPIELPPLPPPPEVPPVGLPPLPPLQPLP